MAKKGEIDVLDVVLRDSVKKDEDTFEIEKIEKHSPFDYIKAINSKKDLFLDQNHDSEQLEKQYNAYIINRGFSYFIDTILYANEMNLYPDIPSRVQYYYYMQSIRKGNRFSKWFKAEKNEDLNMVQKVYGVKPEVAKQYLKLLDTNDLDRLREITAIGENTKKINKKVK